MAQVMVQRATGAAVRNAIEPPRSPRSQSAAGLGRRLVRREFADPWAFLALARQFRPSVAWSDGAGGGRFVAWGASEIFEPRIGQGPPLEQISSWQRELEQRCEEVAPDWPLVVFGAAFSPELPWGAWQGWPRAYAFVPRVLAFVDAHGDSGLLLHGDAVAGGALPGFAAEPDAGGRPAAGPPAAGHWVPEPLPGAYRAAVDELLAAIERGAVDKVVLARAATLHARAGERFCPLQTALALRARHPRAVSFLVELGRESFVGATPELLAAVRQGVLRSQAVAGTSMTEDDPEGRALAQSDKDRREHAWVVDGICRALAPWGEPRLGPTHVERAGDVQHLVSELTLPLPPGASVLDAAARLHPTAALCGEPRASAARFVAELEHVERGWYAGPLGWCSPRGDGVVAVAIRSLLMTAERATAFAGAGIVRGSRPESEWLETEHKLRSAQAGLRTIPGRGCSADGGVT